MDTTEDPVERSAPNSTGVHVPTKTYLSLYCAYLNLFQFFSFSSVSTFTFIYFLLLSFIPFHYSFSYLSSLCWLFIPFHLQLPHIHLCSVLLMIISLLSFHVVYIRWIQVLASLFFYQRKDGFTKKCQIEEDRIFRFSDFQSLNMILGKKVWYFLIYFLKLSFIFGNYNCFFYKLILKIYVRLDIWTVLYLIALNTTIILFVGNRLDLV